MKIYFNIFLQFTNIIIIFILNLNETKPLFQILIHSIILMFMSLAIILVFNCIYFIEMILRKHFANFFHFLPPLHQN